jgi:hypothetical protein
MSMFTPAKTSSSILSWNGRSVAYLLAAEMNIKAPASAAMRKHAQVQGRTSSVTSVTGRLVHERPSSRKSTIAMDPTTMAMAMTWMVSMVGKT